MSEASAVKDVGTEDFPAAVLERSKTVPVVVDFWAPWCGPCRVLGPIIEKEVAALDGRAELVKVNTDENPDLAYQYGIQGIPAVKAFRDGKVVSEFVGAIPAPQIQRFLKQLVPAPGLAALEKAEADARAGRLAEAESALRGLTTDGEVKDRAQLALASLLIDASRAEEARAVMAQIDPRSQQALELPTLERRLQFAADAAAYGGEEKARAAVARDANDLEALYALASALAARGASQEALEHFLTIAARNRKFKDDGARLAMLTIFDQLGAQHELSQDYRRRLQIVL
jgi:putative thioredoxin